MSGSLGGASVTAAGVTGIARGTGVGAGGVGHPAGGLGPLGLSSALIPQQALAGTTIGAVTGTSPNSTLTLVNDGSGRVAQSGNGLRLVAGLTPTLNTDGPFTVTVRETKGPQTRDSVITLTVQTLDPATVSLLGAFTAQPTAAVAAAYDRFVRSLKASGLWAALDVLYMPCHDSQSSRVNWKAPGTYTAAITGTVDFQAFKGHKSDGTSGYLGSAFNPATNGVQFTANNAAVGWHTYPDFTAGVPFNNSDTNFDVGTGSGQLRVQARAGGSIGGRLNSTNTGSPLTVPTSIGFNLLMRRDVNNTYASKDGSAAVALANTGAGTVASSTLFWCGNVVAGNYSSRRIGVVFLGRALADAECATMAQTIETYFREVGVWVDENTRGPALLSTDSAAWASMSSQVIPDVAVIGTRRFRVNYGVHAMPLGTSGEGAGSYNRISYSDDSGQTYSFGCAWVSQTPATESVIDPHITALPDGRLLLVSPYNGTGGKRSIWAYVLTNPTAAPASWVWTAPTFQGYGFVGSAYLDGPDVIYTQNNPLLGQTGDGDYFCRMTFAAGLPVTRVVSLMPNATPSATMNDYGERILARRPDGSLFAAFRVQSTNLYYSTSTAAQDGAAWTAPAPWTVFPNPSSRVATALSPTGNRYVVGNNSSTSRSALTLWQLAPDMMSVTRSLLLDGRGATSGQARVSYPGLAFSGSGAGTQILVDWDVGRGIQDVPAYTNELPAAVIGETSFLAGSTAKTVYNLSRLHDGPLGELSVFTRASVALDADASTGVLSQVAADTPRRGGAVRSPILIEGFATNLEPRSTPFTLWTDNGAPTVTDAAGTAPDGTSSAVSYSSSGANSGRYGPTIASTNGVTYTQSIYLKNVTTATDVIVGSDANPATANIHVNLVTGAITSVGAAITSSRIVAAANGYWRVSWTFVATSTTLAFVIYGGAASQTWLAWGAQCEANTIATSLIPTAGATATRALDTLTMSGVPFAAIFGSAAAGFVIADVLMDAHSNAVRVPFQLDDGTSSNRIGVRPSQAATGIIGVTTQGGTISNVTIINTAPTFGTLQRYGMRWGGGTFSGCFNGSAIQSTALAAASYTTLRIGNDNLGTAQLNGRVRAWGGAYAPSDAAFAAACAAGADVYTILRGV